LTAAWVDVAQRRDISETICGNADGIYVGGIEKKKKKKKK